MLLDHALYQVATKALLFKNDKLLLLSEANGTYDFAGGRIDSTEFEIPLSEALSREIREELGDEIQYELGDIAFVTKRFYVDNTGFKHHIIALYFTAKYTGGDIKLSDEHAHFSWVNPTEILANPEHFVSQDEFEQFKKYFTK